MLHLQHYLLFIRREFSDYTFLILFISGVNLALPHLVSMESAELMAMLISVGFLLILMIKSGIRRVFFIHFPGIAGNKSALWVTREFYMVLLISASVFVLAWLVALAGRWLEWPSLHGKLIVQIGLWMALMLPPLLAEPAMSTVRESTLAWFFRWTSRLGFPVVLLAAFFIPVSETSLIRLFIAMASFRFLLFLILILHYQLLDFFITPPISWNRSLFQSARVMMADVSLWLLFMAVIFFIWYQSGHGYRMIWLTGAQLFVVVILVAAQMLSLWSLIFKNFIRLEADSQFILYVQHVNTWFFALFFAIIPLFLLLLSPLVRLETGQLSLPIDWTMLVAAMSALSVGSYFLSNPLAEMLVLMERQREVSVFSGTALVILFLVGWLFYTMNGVWGLFLAPLFAGSIFWIGVNSQIQQLLSCDYKYIFPYRKLFYFLLISMGALAAGVYVSNLTGRLGLVISAYLVTYLLLLYVSRLIRGDSQNGFLNWSRRIGNFH